MLPFPEYACHGGGEWGFSSNLGTVLNARIPYLGQGTWIRPSDPDPYEGMLIVIRASTSLLSVLSLSLVCPSSKTTR